MCPFLQLKICEFRFRVPKATLFLNFRLFQGGCNKSLFKALFWCAQLGLMNDLLIPSHFLQYFQQNEDPISLVLLRLSESADTTGPWVNPICLPGGEQPSEGQTCYVTGFGITG